MLVLDKIFNKISEHRVMTGAEPLSLHVSEIVASMLVEQVGLEGGWVRHRDSGDRIWVNTPGGASVEITWRT